MITRFFITGILLLFQQVRIFPFSQPATTGITLSISGLRNNSGHVLVSLFKDNTGFPDDPLNAYRKTSLAIKDRKASIHFAAVPPGIYAFAILHDENDDTEMNTNWLGLPKEGYGFSNNVMGTFGPPGFSKASFQHTETRVTEVLIKTRY